MKTYEVLTYINSRGEQLVLSVGSKYHVNVSKDVSGLSDISNVIYSTSSMGQHGDTYVGTRVEPRDITIKGKIKDDDKAAQLELRRNMVRVLNPELDGTLYYSYGAFVRKIGARVEAAPTFSRSSLSQEFQIDFICLSPFWELERESVDEIASWHGAWEFPCEIDQNDSTSMIFGYRDESVIVDVYNQGDVSTGMRIVFRALGDVTNPVLLNVDTQEYIKVNKTMVAGDVITVNTNYGQKGITLTSGGTETNVYRYLDVDSTFLQLEIGDNLLRYDATSGVDSLEVTIYYSPLYLGV